MPISVSMIELHLELHGNPVRVSHVVRNLESAQNQRKTPQDIKKSIKKLRPLTKRAIHVYPLKTGSFTAHSEARGI